MLVFQVCSFYSAVSYEVNMFLQCLHLDLLLLNNFWSERNAVVDLVLAFSAKVFRTRIHHH